ncbi:M23 family metallopeptidase [Granulicella cerasi]|uniref:M23 family metallopeptidase n=1 Tax=Granulicella cerasi TaxID=741063 RepID=A0ABW1Z8X9_9BACT|nr:M23 family metallopeptidase [Granulicella cerasi]
MRKRYFVYVTRNEDGTSEEVNIPMRYVYVFLAATITGMFTIAGMAGSYSRMLAKAETINHLRDELANSRKDYAHLEKQTHDKDVQVASLGSLASEVSAIYGLTAGKLTLPLGHGLRIGRKNAVGNVADAKLKDDTASFTDDSYYKSLDTFYALKNTAASGALMPSNTPDMSIGIRSGLSGLGAIDLATGTATPDMWPVMGPINSGFGEREDPVIGGGTGEFHKGVDIGSPLGTPVHAPAPGRVVKAGMGNGYGREIEIDHGNGIKTVYGHLSGWNVSAGETVVKGQVIGFVGHSGRTTGNHLHYEVQVRGNAVNPHKYLRTTMAQLGGATGTGG